MQPDTQNDSYAELARATLAASRELIAHSDRWRQSDVNQIRVTAWVAVGAAFVLLVSCIGFWWRAEGAERVMSDMQASTIQRDHEMRTRMAEMDKRVNALEAWKAKQVTFNEQILKALEAMQ